MHVVIFRDMTQYTAVSRGFICHKTLGICDHGGSPPQGPEAGDKAASFVRGLCLLGFHLRWEPATQGPAARSSPGPSKTALYRWSNLLEYDCLVVAGTSTTLLARKWQSTLLVNVGSNESGFE